MRSCGQCCAPMKGGVSAECRRRSQWTRSARLSHTLSARPLGSQRDCPQRDRSRRLAVHQPVDLLAHRQQHHRRGFVRNMQAQWATRYYDAYGYWTSVNGALATWGIIAGLDAPG